MFLATYSSMKVTYQSHWCRLLEASLYHCRADRVLSGNKEREQTGLEKKICRAVLTQTYMIILALLVTQHDKHLVDRSADFQLSTSYTIAHN